MLTLCQFPGTPAVVNYSPFCMKVECVLRMLDLDYRVQSLEDFETAPRRQVPYIVDEGEIVGDSRLIVDHVQRKYGFDLDRALSPVARATAHALQSMIEQHLYFALAYSRWTDDAGWKKAMPLFFAGVPEVQRSEVAACVRAETVGRLWQQGLGRHASEQVYRFAAADIDAAAALLGTTPFLFGEIPGLTDAVLYAFVAGMTAPPFDGPLRTHTCAHRNLIDHAERMRARFFPMVPALAA
ncbi:MAG: glutathione S-transferase family protein [Alphaproteobacteria bacterium]